MAKSKQSFSEYTKLRDIVVKRNKRAAAAGLAPLVHFPTVKEIRKGLVNPEEAMRAVRDFYSSGSQVKTIRQTGLVPQFKSFPALPKEPKRTTDEIREHRREQQRDYRRRKKIVESAKTPKEARSLLYAYRAIKTIERIWNRDKKRLGISLSSMTPTEAVAFTEYINYRFSQGDFTQIYVIDEFIQDFSKLRKQGYTANQIQKDFDAFLENRTQLQTRASKMEGIPPDELRKYWDEFVGD